MDVALRGSFEAPASQNQSHNSTMVSYTLNNINKIILNLEKSNRKHKLTADNDMTLIQENVSALMTKFTDNSNDLSKDLRKIVDTFGVEDRFDADQLEALVEFEQQRSQNILQLAGYLDSQVNKLFLVVNSIFYHLKQGKQVPANVQTSVATRFNVVQETIASSSPTKMNQIMEQAEKDIEEANIEANSELRLLQEGPAVDTKPIDPPVPTTDMTLEEPSYGEFSVSSAESDERSLWDDKHMPIMIPTRPEMVDAESQTEETRNENQEQENAVVEPPEFDPPWGAFDSPREEEDDDEEEEKSLT